MPPLQFSSKFCCALSLSLIYSRAEECSWWPFAKMPQWREPIYLHSDERSLKIMEKAELHYKGKCYLCMRIVIWWFKPKMWVMAAALVCVFGATYVTLLCVKKSLCEVFFFFFFGWVMGQPESKLSFSTGVLEHMYATHVKIPWRNRHVCSHPQYHI